MTFFAAERRLSHIAVIMDGNGRWARQRQQPRSEGHRHGLQAARQLADVVAQRGIADYLTLFAFSNENWRRPQEEVGALLRLFSHAIEEDRGFFGKRGICLRFIGDVRRFPRSLQTGMAGLERLTRGGRRLTLTLALGYSGRWDILQAAQNLAAAGEAFSEENFERYLTTAATPPPDLLIRTGGDMRISNFMLWQSAYTELYFTDTLWPDFGEAGLGAAVADFHRRERRFGRVNGDDDGDNGDNNGNGNGNGDGGGGGGGGDNGDGE